MGYLNGMFRDRYSAVTCVIFAEVTTNMPSMYYYRRQVTTVLLQLGTLYIIDTVVWVAERR